MFISGYEPTPAYQPNYLQERVQTYQDFYADGELIIAWLGKAIAWVGSRLVAWGQVLQPRQNPRQSWVS